MNIKKLADGSIEIELHKSKLAPIARAIIGHAEDMHSTVLDFADILRAAGYAMRDNFRQPPHAWDAGARHPSMQK